MSTAIRLACAALVSLSMLSPMAQAEDGGAPASVEARLADAKSGPIVAVKLVLAMSIQVRGETQNQEANIVARGVVVDESGLVMLSTVGFSAENAMGIPPAQMRQLREQMGLEVKATPTNIRIVFPGDEREYPAILGAQDSKLGLAFALIKDMGEKKVQSIDWTSTVEPRMGAMLYGVTRMTQAFDYAPVCKKVNVVSKISKPRKMWLIDEEQWFVGKPLYDANGALAGVVSQQKGVGEEEPQTCLLPVKIVQATVARSLKSARDALAEALEAEKEAEKAAEDEKDDEDKEGDGEGDGGE